MHGRRQLAIDERLAPGAHKRSRVVMPLQSASAPAGELVVEHIRAPNRGKQEYGETLGMQSCRLTLALRRGRTRVFRNGALLHEGDVFPGMVRLSKPGDTIEGEVFTAMEAVSVCMPAERLADRLPARSMAGVKPILQPNAQTEQLGRLLLHLLRIDRQYAEMFCGGIVDALLALMLDDAGRPSGDVIKRSFGPTELQRIVDFADDRIGVPLGLAEWSAAFGLPTSEFSRRFRTATGSAPYTYFLRRRIERAQELMAETAAPLAEIALDVGFSSQSHFTEAFRRIAGISPGHWRRHR